MLVIFLAVNIDQFIGGQAPIFRTLAIYFYAGREGLSLIENFGVLGVPWPPAIRNALEQFKAERRGEQMSKGFDCATPLTVKTAAAFASNILSSLVATWYRVDGKH